MPKGGLIMKFTFVKKLILIAVCLCLASCTQASNDTQASDLASKTISECQSLAGSYSVYLAKGTEGQTGYLCDDDFYELYYTKTAHANELLLLDDWCIALSRSGTPRELHVLKLKSKSERPKIKEMLERRKKRLLSPELYGAQSDFLYTRPSQAEVFYHGYFVILCASDDVGSVIKLLG
jgi:hypothetical protein